MQSDIFKTFTVNPSHTFEIAVDANSFAWVVVVAAPTAAEDGEAIPALLKQLAGPTVILI